MNLSIYLYVLLVKFAPVFNQYEAYNTCSLMDEGLNFISKPLKLCKCFEHLGLCHIGCKH